MISDDAATLTESTRSSICGWERNTQPGIGREDEKNEEE